VLFSFSLSTFSYNDFLCDNFQQDGQRQRQRDAKIACMQRKEEKRVQALVRIRERKKSYFVNTRRAIPVADGDEDEELSNAVVEDINVEVANNTSQHALPAFQVGEIISVEGDTTERGYTYLFVYFLRHVFLHSTMAVKRRYKSTGGVGSIKEYVGYIEEKHW
jgi:hypothetical protein